MTVPPLTTAAQPASRRRSLAWLFLVAAAGMFIVRGPVRAVRSMEDLVPNYGASRALLLGEDPYSAASLNRVLVAAGRKADAQGRATGHPSVYPPPSLLAFAPIAVLRWEPARFTFLLFCLALFAWQLGAVVRLSGLESEESMRTWLAAAVLAFAPFHTGIALGQAAIPSATLLVIAIDRIQRRRERSGGALLALATLFKPQLAGPFILYYLLRGRRRGAIIAMVVCAIATLVSIAWLEMQQIEWWSGWRAMLRNTAVNSAEHDPAGAWSAQMLELRPLITALTGMHSSGPIGLVISIMLALAVYVRGRTMSEEWDLLLLSNVAVLSLFATYHRFYDAAVLTVVLAWAARTLVVTRELRAHAIAAAVCASVFFVPGAWMLQRLANDGTLPTALTSTMVWNALIIRHQNWALVAMFVALWLALCKAARQPAATSPT